MSIITPMHNVLKFLICLSLCLQNGIEFEGTDKHLFSYSKFNQTAHDNIDDTAEDHAHRHKHSDDGEEHEHKHSHTEINYSQLKMFFCEQTLNLSFNIIKAKRHFSYKSHLSSPPIFGIFRPPIS